MLYNSKLALTACSHFLGLKLAQEGVRVQVNSLHPGFLQRKEWQNVLLNVPQIRKILDKLLMVSWALKFV
jgi:NAD(P)-dependent dehydrogenase (short-subunit alcohol dehydrogenase family)